MSYIKKSDLIKAVEDEIFINPSVRSKFKQIIYKQPTADVVEVRHGKWEAYGLRNPQCSLCRGYNIEHSNYCPKCGAKMDGERRKK